MSAQNEFKVLIDGLEVKYEIQPQVYESKDSIQKGLSDIDVQLAEINSKVDEYNTEIDRLTNNADGFDYTTSRSMRQGSLWSHTLVWPCCSIPTWHLQ